MLGIMDRTAAGKMERCVSANPATRDIKVSITTNIYMHTLTFTFTCFVDRDHHKK